MSCFVPKSNAKSIPILALTKTAYRRWSASQSKPTKNWLKAQGFEAAEGSIAKIPGRDGNLAKVVLGLGTGGDLWTFAHLPGGLPKGRYAFEGLDPARADAAALAWALACYRFDRYKSASKPLPLLVWPEGCDRAQVERTAAATALARDLVNTPAGDLGPAELAAAAKEVAKAHGASCKIIHGRALLDAGYPAIHAVGRGSERAPQLVDLQWGDASHRKVTLVGKGVVFDSGGLDLKPSAGMKLMKKDMGGAAMALGLASMIMGAKMKVRLRVLIPAVENSVAGDAYRPLDVLRTRKGLTVEVGNTDAEGRLVLCDALAEADGEHPDLLLDFATLTGAARVALGTELPALFCNDDALAAEILGAGLATDDPLWRLPLHQPYRRHLESKVADLCNVANIAQGGAITAALFLQEFVASTTPWVHIDTMAWNLGSRAGRPVGGEVFGMRAIYAVLAARYGFADAG